MFVTDTLNVVLAIAVVKKRWAFKRFDCSDMRTERCFQMVSRSDSARRACGRNEGACLQFSISI